jgi:hypothetical protein
MGFLKIRANGVGYPSYGGCFVWVGNIITPLLCRKFGLLCTDFPQRFLANENGERHKAPSNCRILEVWGNP